MDGRNLYERLQRPIRCEFKMERYDVDLRIKKKEVYLLLFIYFNITIIFYHKHFFLFLAFSLTNKNPKSNSVAVLYIFNNVFLSTIADTSSKNVFKS